MTLALENPLVVSLSDIVTYPNVTFPASSLRQANDP